MTQSKLDPNELDSILSTRCDLDTRALESTLLASKLNFEFFVEAKYLLSFDQYLKLIKLKIISIITT